MVATAVHSIEIELAWGWHDRERENRYESLSSDRTTETETLVWLLDIGDKYGIPFTFDIVAHLLCPSCDGSHAGPHSPGWFKEDPGTDVGTDPLFYAPDLVRMIRDARVDHEICTHTFSHVSADSADAEVVRWELERAVEKHRDFGLPTPRSFVPPRHQCPSYGVFETVPINVVRRKFDSFGHPDNRLGRFLATLLRRHPVGRLTRRDGIVETYTTAAPSLTAPYLPTGQRPPHRAYAMLPLSVRQRRHQDYLIGGLERAIRQGSQTHYWTHLSNLSATEQQRPVENYFEELGARQDSGRIEAIRMVDCRELVEGP